MGKTEDGKTLQDSLHEYGVTEVDIVGIATDYCVAESAIDASKNEFKVNILSNYVATINQERLEMIKNNQFVEFSVNYI